MSTAWKEMCLFSTNESPKNQGLIWSEILDKHATTLGRIGWSVSHKIFSLAAILKNTVKLG